MSQPAYQRAIVILADGARADVMEEELAAGRLPNITRYLVQPGSGQGAVTAFPSTTGPAYLPFLTGCFPGSCNVPGIRWVDKGVYRSGGLFPRHRSYVGLESFMMARDMWPHIKTIFQIVPRSYSIFNPVARGTGFFENRTRISRIWYWYYAHLTDHWIFVDESALKKLRQVIKLKPKFVFAVFPGIDTYAHLAGPWHPTVRERYHYVDQVVGKVVGDLKARGEWDTTALFLVSDHGLSETHTHFCMNRFLDEHGLNPFFYPLVFHKKGRLSANMMSGNGMTHLYFKNGGGWSKHTLRQELEQMSPGLLEDLLGCEAVDIIACRGQEDWIDVLSRRGRARLKLDGSQLHYEVGGRDPFGYAPLPPDLDPQSSLDCTYDTEYPDAPFQIAHLMTAPRSGDVVISASPGFDLRLAYENPEHRGTHGSLHRSHMWVPLFSNVPLARRPARTADVFPTILKLLGYEIPGHIDGVMLRQLQGVHLGR